MEHQRSDFENLHVNKIKEIVNVPLKWLQKFDVGKQL